MTQPCPRIIGVTQRVPRTASGTLATAAQTSACKHLVIVAEIEGNGFTGGFIALHVPTGRVLQVGQWVGSLTPAMVSDAIGRVSHLDWSNPDRDFYRQGEHCQAWKTAVADAVELRPVSDLTEHQHEEFRQWVTVAREWEEEARFQTNRAARMQHAHDQVAGRRGNQIGQLRKQVAAYSMLLRRMSQRLRMYRRLAVSCDCCGRPGPFNFVGEQEQVTECRGCGASWPTDQRNVPADGDQSANQLDGHGGGMWTEAFERLQAAHLAGAPREEIERLSAEELDELLQS